MGGAGRAIGGLIAGDWERATGGAEAKVAAFEEEGCWSPQADPAGAGISPDILGAVTCDAAFGDAGGPACGGTAAHVCGCGTVAGAPAESGMPQKPQNLLPAG